MKVLGFDPGVSKSGWAIICSENGLVAVSYTHLTLPTNREV